jgi:hypothetical protein
MQKFEFEVGGRLYDWPKDWGVGQSLKFGKCTFTREKTEGGTLVEFDLSVTAQIEANNAEEARKLGFDT